MQRPACPWRTHRPIFAATTSSRSRSAKAAWDAFLAEHSDGFYARLAKLQIEKIGAEQAHAAAIAKAKQAEAERDRLAVLGAQKDAQAKAAADAKAAEQAQLAAQKAKEQAELHAATAEQQRVDLAAAAPSAAPGSPASPADVTSLTPATTPADLNRLVQAELGRVGCFSDAADGNWNTSSQRSLSQFNRYAGTKLDVRVASADALDAVKAKSSRVCPLVCEHGFKADGDKCTRILCAEGYVLNAEDECEKKRAAKPAASRPATSRRDESEDRPARQRRQAGDAAAGDLEGLGVAAGTAAAARAGRAAVGGQVFCSSTGCRPVSRGCHLEYRGGGGPGNDASAEICH